jgi:DNA-binding LacI/PurR family transcriptional regulator
MSAPSQARAGTARRRPTSADVARLAGVSRATVSYVLNDTPHQSIPEATRRRVLAAAAELGYTPSAAARALRSGRSDIVLALLPDWPIGPAVGGILEQLSVALAAEGLTFLAHPQVTGRVDLAQLWKAISPVAVLNFGQLGQAEIDSIRAAGVDVTLSLMGGTHGGRALFADLGKRTGRIQAEHLAARGHARFGYAYPDNPRVGAIADARLDGVRAACADLGLGKPDVRTIPLAPQPAADAVAAWRKESPPVTGICAFNDQLAFAVLAGLRARGLHAPQDMAVTGVDDIPTAALADPPLTTVTVDPAILARHAVRHIIAALNGERAPSRPGPDPLRLLIRGSV